MMGGTSACVCGGDNSVKARCFSPSVMEKIDLIKWIKWLSHIWPFCVSGRFSLCTYGLLPPSKDISAGQLLSINCIACGCQCLLLLALCRTGDCLWCFVSHTQSSRGTLIKHEYRIFLKGKLEPLTSQYFELLFHYKLFFTSSLSSCNIRSCSQKKTNAFNRLKYHCAV